MVDLYSFLGKTPSSRCLNIDEKERALFARIERTLNSANVVLVLNARKVKHINFRIKPTGFEQTANTDWKLSGTQKNNKTSAILQVSYPKYTDKITLYSAINERLYWAVAASKKLHLRQNSPYQLSLLSDGMTVPLWAEKYKLKLEVGVGSKAKTSVNHSDKIIRVVGDALADQAVVMTALEQVYRQELKDKMPQLFEKWQPIVGAVAKQTRLKKMTTRWGSCNSSARRIWLSIYLAKYPLECCEYVVVHELCHLLEANHSARFWTHVARSMPEYKHWHDYLKNNGLTDVG